MPTLALFPKTKLLLLLTIAFAPMAVAFIRLAEATSAE